MGYHDILNIDVPCWYEVSWRKELGIIVRVHKDFVAEFEPLTSESPMLRWLNEQNSPKVFNAEFGKNFGVNGVMPYLGESGDFLEYQAPVVLCRKIKGDCPACKGTGKSKDPWRDKCFRCMGECKEIYYDYNEALEISTSLGLLLELLRFPEVKTSSSFPQLLTLHTSHSKNRFFVNGEYSVRLVHYLRLRPTGSVPEMVEAMISVSEKMEGRSPDAIDRHQFSAETTRGGKGWLNVGCPGQACGLNPSHNFSGRFGVGYEFYDHNVDQPMQQMMLATSVCALHDLARSQK